VKLDLHATLLLMEWDVMGRDGIGGDGMGRNEMEWDGM
jgi:hypothetical protein